MINFKNCNKCGGKSVDHEQEHVSFKKYDVCVDKGLSYLLKLLWGEGIDTNFSCIGEFCDCGVESCRMGMSNIVFWSDDNLKKFLDFFDRGDDCNLIREYELFLHISGWKKKYTIVKSTEEIFSQNKKTAVWRWEAVAAAATLLKENENTLEGVPVPSQYRDRIRWNLMFPREDIPAMIRVITNTKVVERKATQYTLDNGEIRSIGCLYYKDGELTSDGIYSDTKVFNEIKSESEWGKNSNYWKLNSISCEDFVKIEKHLHEENITNMESGQWDITRALEDLPETYVVIETII